MYAAAETANVALNSLKNQPNAKSKTLASQSRCSCRGLSSRAQRAGLSVSAFITESSVETAIVSANCLKNIPLIPVRNTQGRNTQESTRPIATSAPETSSIALHAAA